MFSVAPSTRHRSLQRPMAWQAAKRLQFVSCLPNQFPNIPKMLLVSEYDSQTDPHDCATAQFRLRKISSHGSIDLLHNLAVDHIDLLIVAGGCETETDNAHHNRRGQFETLVLLNPIGKEFGQAQVLANARGHSSAAERAPNDPRLERAKATTQLYAIIHVVDLGADGIAKVQMLGRESKEAPQTPDIAQRRHVHSKLAICRNALDVVLANPDRNRAFFHGAVRLITSVNPKRGQTESA